MKICSKCNVGKETVEFAKTGRKEGLFSSLCKSCSSKKSSAWNKLNKDKRRVNSRKNKLKTLYGLSIEQFDEMVISQKSRCAICFAESKLVVDHDHLNGKVRSLLCNSCNRGIGYLRDNSTVLKNAIAYLEKHANS